VSRLRSGQGCQRCSTVATFVGVVGTSQCENMPSTSSPFRLRSVPPLPCVVFAFPHSLFRHLSLFAAYSSFPPFISSSFSVIVARHRRRTVCRRFLSSFYSSLPSRVFVVAVTFRHVLLMCRHVCLIVVSRFIRCLIFLLFCLSVMNSFSFFLVGLSVCLSVKRLPETFIAAAYGSRKNYFGKIIFLWGRGQLLEMVGSSVRFTCCPVVSTSARLFPVSRNPIGCWGLALRAPLNTASAPEFALSGFGS
jgi:hypothetical protein